MKDNINFTTNVSLSLKHLLGEQNISGHAILVDENTEKHCLPVLNDSYIKNIISIPSGESNKSLEQCAFIWLKMTEFNLDRNSILINFGGGVICDLGAFCASTFKRGIKFVNIPTTLLAMTDASIGGKSGFNFLKFKNQIGLFTEAEKVIVNPVFLDTLPERELRSGYAESIKHAIIAAPELWELTQFKENSKKEWKDLIEHSLKVKEKIVNEDFKESGKRKLLNYGHTIGHLIESYHLLENQIPKLHGEAIAVGMMVEAFIAYQKYMLKEKDLIIICERIVDIFEPELISDDEKEYILENLVHDKKNSFKKLSFSLPEKIGKASFDIEVKKEEVITAIKNYNEYLA